MPPACPGLPQGTCLGAGGERLAHEVHEDVAFHALAFAPDGTRVVTASASNNKDTSVIIIYTKETCPLCDGLKDKVTAILERAPFTGSALNGFTIQPRDIMSNPEWEQRYSMEIPVLAVVRTDGSEHVVPRQSPRAPVDRLEQAIVEALEQAM